jgi:hypothetical protein
MWQKKPCILGTYRTSRHVWKQLYGDPGTARVLHRCGNGTCREPSHLYLGTDSQNLKDAYRLGERTKDAAYVAYEAWRKYDLPQCAGCSKPIRVERTPVMVGTVPYHYTCSRRWYRERGQEGSTD